jgi:hypothetical protein
MQNNTYLRSVLLSLIGMMLLTACAEAPVETRTVELTANIVTPPGVEGPIEVRVFHAWSLEGDLRHPLQLIEIFEADTGRNFTRTFEYPSEGEGLAVWAYVDTDGDGVHCTPDVRNDLSGLSVDEGAVPDQVEVTVNLTEPCRAPGWFYPPAG